MDAITTKYYLSCGIFKKWHDKTLDDFVNDIDAKKTVLKYLKNHKAYKKDGVGLFIWGANGVGKSLLLNTSFIELINLRYKVRIVDFSELITSFANGWNDKDDREVLRELKNCDFLGIEEIGKEFNSRESELAKTVLDNVLRYRVQNCKPTWFTTNLKPSEIKIRYKEDTYSLLKEACIPVQVLGSDYRDIVREKIKSI
jgi:DNA replication protein DnaC